MSEHSRKDDAGVLYYKNIGTDSATNIQTWEKTLNLFSIIFPKVNLLEPKEKREVIPRISGRTQLTEHFVNTFDGLEIDKFPYFIGQDIHWYTIVTHYESLKGKKYLSVVLVLAKAQKVEHKLNGPEWWINLLDKLRLIKNLPKPPKDAHLYTSD